MNYCKDINRVRKGHKHHHIILSQTAPTMIVPALPGLSGESNQDAAIYGPIMNSTLVKTIEYPKSTENSNTRPISAPASGTLSRSRSNSSSSSPAALTTIRSRSNSKSQLPLIGNGLMEPLEISAPGPFNEDDEQMDVKSNGELPNEKEEQQLESSAEKETTAVISESSNLSLGRSNSSEDLGSSTEFGKGN